MIGFDARPHDTRHRRNHPIVRRIAGSVAYRRRQGNRSPSSRCARPAIPAKGFEIVSDRMNRDFVSNGLDAMAGNDWRDVDAATLQPFSRADIVNIRPWSRHILARRRPWQRLINHDLLPELIEHDDAGKCGIIGKRGDHISLIALGLPERIEPAADRPMRRRWPRSVRFRCRNASARTRSVFAASRYRCRRRASWHPGFGVHRAVRAQAGSTPR